MRSPLVCDRPGVVGRGGRQAGGRSPHLYWDLGLLTSPGRGGDLGSSPAALLPHPLPQVRSTACPFPSSQRLLSNQEPFSLVAMEAISEKPFLPTIKAFLSESGSGHLAFPGAGGGGVGTEAVGGTG